MTLAPYLQSYGILTVWYHLTFENWPDLTHGPNFSPLAWKAVSYTHLTLPTNREV